MRKLHCWKIINSLLFPCLSQFSIKRSSGTATFSFEFPSCFALVAQIKTILLKEFHAPNNVKHSVEIADKPESLKCAWNDVVACWYVSLLNGSFPLNHEEWKFYFKGSRDFQRMLSFWVSLTENFIKLWSVWK